MAERKGNQVKEGTFEKWGAGEIFGSNTEVIDGITCYITFICAGFVQGMPTLCTPTNRVES